MGAWVTDAAGTFNAVVICAWVAGIAVFGTQVADPGLADRDEAFLTTRRPWALVRVRARRAAGTQRIAVATRALDARGLRGILTANAGIAKAVGAWVAVVAGVASEIANPVFAGSYETRVV
jgi:hypothetical protein